MVGGANYLMRLVNVPLAPSSLKTTNANTLISIVRFGGFLMRGM
jgi:hypothetical protein